MEHGTWEARCWTL